MSDSVSIVQRVTFWKWLVGILLTVPAPAIVMSFFIAFDRNADTDKAVAVLKKAFEDHLIIQNEKHEDLEKLLQKQFSDTQIQLNAIQTQLKEGTKDRFYKRDWENAEKYIDRRFDDQDEELKRLADKLAGYPPEVPPPEVTNKLKDLEEDIKELKGMFKLFLQREKFGSLDPMP